MAFISYVLGDDKTQWFYEIKKFFVRGLTIAAVLHSLSRDGRRETNTILSEDRDVANGRCRLLCGPQRS
jgi:hypothetical protein